MTTGTLGFLERLRSLVDTRQPPTTANGTLDQLVEQVLRKIAGNQADNARAVFNCVRAALQNPGNPGDNCSSNNANLNALLTNISNAIQQLCQGNQQCQNPQQRPGLLPGLLGALKNAWKNLNSNQKRNLSSISFMADTCYDQNRGQKLLNALQAIENRVGSGLMCGFLALLAAAYTSIISDANSIEYTEWFPYLARGAALAVNNNAYLPVCPGRGDIAAILYYTLLKNCNSTGINISPDNAKEIIVKLAGYTDNPPAS